MNDWRLQIDDLGLSYGPRRVLHHLNWQIGSGQLVALIGPNGSGKTSLLRSVAGAVAVQNGRILVDGHVAGSESARQALGYAVSVEVLPAELSLSDCIQLLAQVRGVAGLDATTQALADRFGLSNGGTPVVRARSAHGETLGCLSVGATRLIVLDESSTASTRPSATSNVTCANGSTATAV